MNAGARVLAVAVVVSCLVAPSALSAADDDHMLLFGTDPDVAPVEKKKWKESAVTLPELPRQQNLVEIPVTGSYSRQAFFIDLNSLSVEPGNVVRYTAYIKSPSNAGNIFYEGIRCIDDNYRIYAYSSGRRPFKRLSNSPWRLVDEFGAQRYRYELLTNHFCNDYYEARKLRDIRNRLKYYRSSTSDAMDFE